MTVKKGLAAAVRVLGCVTAAFLALILAANIYRIVAERLFHVKDPTVFGFYSAVVLTGSMSGTIEPNDLIITHRQSVYEAGDIITYGTEHGTVTHRITEVTQDGYRAKGDSNNAEDSATVLPEQVIGRVVLTVPKIGAAILFFRSPVGILCMLAVLVLATELPQLIKKIKR